jgi:hypothetical protein
VKEKDPKGTSKMLMPPIGIHKPSASENLDGNLGEKQKTHM